MTSFIARAHRLASMGLCAAALGASQAAMADPSAQTAWLRVEAFRADLDTRIRIDDPTLNTVGSEFSLERFGLTDTKTLPAVQLGWRFTERLRLELEYFTLTRSGRTELDRDIVFDGATFDVRSTLDTRFRSDVGRVSVGYSFHRTPELELGAVVGVHVMRFDIGLKSAVSTAGSAAVLQSADAGGTAPLPTVGLYGDWALGSGWTVGGRADYFSIKHRGYDGRLINGQAGVTYRFTPHVAVGGGWRFVDYRLEATRADLRGSIDYRFKGPQLFAEIGF